MKKHRHVPTKEDLFNIDHRPSATMRLLMTEKERNLHSAYLECDLEKYPVLSVGDVQIKTLEDFNSFKGDHDFGLIGIADSDHSYEDLQCMSEDLLDVLHQDFKEGKY